jgi:hypothetical protein
MTRLADAYDALAEAAAAVAIELRAETPQDAPHAGPASDTTTWTETDDWAEDTKVIRGPEVEPLRLGPQELHAEQRPKPAGSAAVCPAHNIEYRDGTYGSYCPSLSDDPEWSNAKGYCRITPKNAAVWLRKTAAAGKR